MFVVIPPPVVWYVYWHSHRFRASFFIHGPNSSAPATAGATRARKAANPAGTARL